MASETRKDQSSVSDREPPKGQRPSSRPPTQGSPRIGNDGPELPRSNLC
jgi:hypothetical protein